MKIKNRYNIGDYVWIGKENPKQQKIMAVHISVYDNYDVKILYKTDKTPYHTIGVSEDSCFLTKEECMKGERFGAVKGTAIRMSGVLLRFLFSLSVFILSVPILTIQIVHWFFTGRKEPFTYRLMTKINDKLMK